jgi:catechol 2,3-dioxygenase-like lactoylglutathione lyase family enzyme
MLGRHMSAEDERPGLWVGHVAMNVTEPARSHDYYVGLGLRSVLRGDDFAITELRGGTHLILEPGEVEPGDAPFDLMVEDLAATHARFRAAELNVSDIIPGEIHDVFVLEDPDGQRIVVYNSHVVGPV